MEPTRVDAISKTVGHARSRRTMLKMLGVAALGAIGRTRAGVTAA